MKKLFFSLSLLSSLVFANGTGAAGSAVESFQVLPSIKLIKDDNTTVTILDGTKWLELKSASASSAVAAALSAVRPADGTYVGVEMNATKFRYKAKIVSGSTTYYTKDTNVTLNTPMNLSTNSADYNDTTISSPNGEVTIAYFGKPLVLTSGTNSSLVFVNQYLSNDVTYETNSTIDQSTWLGETAMATTFLPELPTKKIVFNLVYTKTGSTDQTNTITIFLNSSDEFLGAYMMRPNTNKALNGSFMMQGSKSGNTYTIRFQDGDDSTDGIVGNDYYSVTSTVDCNTTSYSATSVSAAGTGTTQTTNLSNMGYALTTSGSVTCSTLSITQ